MSIKSLCVFCGSNVGIRDLYVSATQSFGQLLAQRQIALVYGGGRVGLMGALADATLQAGGKVIGVMPKLLYDKEIAHEQLTELRVVGSMSERKATMAELADAFVALPGGVGTLDEIFEVWTWTLLQLQSKACGMLNVNGYFDPLIAFLDRATDEKFLFERHRKTLLIDQNAERLLNQLDAFNLSYSATPKVDRT